MYHGPESPNPKKYVCPFVQKTMTFSSFIESPPKNEKLKLRWAGLMYTKNLNYEKLKLRWAGLI